MFRVHHQLCFCARVLCSRFSGWKSLVAGGVVAVCVSGPLLQDVSAQALPQYDASARESAEISSREEAIMATNHYLSQGDSYLSQGKKAAAASNYRSAVESLPAGDAVGAYRRIAMGRFTTTATEYAEELIDAGRYTDAGRVLDVILSPEFAPDHKPAIQLRKELKDVDYVNPADTAEHRENVDEVSRLLQEGEAFLQIGRFDDATVRFSEVLGADRYNVAARRGLSRAARLKSNYSKAAYDDYRASAFKDSASRWESNTTEISRIDLDAPGAASEFAPPQSEDIAKKLARLIVPEVLFQNATAEEAVRFLNSMSRELDVTEPDPRKRGVNFVLSSSEAIDRLRPFSLKLRGIPLSELLVYITRSIGARFRIESFAVRIIPIGDIDDALINRTFTVPPDFISATQVTGDASDDPFADSPAGGGNIVIRRLTAEDFLKQQGIPFPDGASAQYFPGNNKLLITNTFDNLQLIEDIIIASRSVGPKQVKIQVKLLEINYENLEELGFDWLLGPFTMRGSTLAGAGGDPNVMSEFFSFTDPVTGEAIGGNRVTGGLRSGEASLGVDNLDLILNRDRVSSDGSLSVQPTPGTLAISGVMTNPQFQVVLRALSQTTGADILAAPAVVAKSTQRAKIEIQRELIYPEEYDPPELPQSVGTNAAGSFPVTPATPTAFTMRPVGFVLEVDPVIGEDNYTVDLNLAPEFVTLEGFVNYGTPIISNVPNLNPFGPPTIAVVLTENRIVMPVFKTSRVTDSVTVWDGYTIVLGGLTTERIDHIEDKVPILGDAPLIGRFFRSNLDRKTAKSVIFFVSVEIIDAGGNRINQPRVIEETPEPGPYYSK